MKLLLGMCIVFCLIGFPALAQEVNFDNVDPSDYDFSKVDVSDAQFYLNGPIELFVANLKYAGEKYVATLDYNGGNTFGVKVPVVRQVGMRPQTADLSDVEIKPAQDGVILDNVIVDGVRYSGKVVPSGGNQLKIVSYSALGPVTDQAEVRLAEYRKELRQKDAEINSREQEIQSKEQEIESLMTRMNRMRAESTGPVATPGEAEEQVFYTNMLGKDFKRARATSGSWSTSNNTLEQSDRSQKYAKYLVSQNQNAEKLNYSFHVRANNNGWRGAGLHFLVSDNSTVAGYGLGKSYLVWVTRDEGAMQTDKTYIQLYKSMNDVRMIEVKSSITNEDIALGIDIEVYVDKWEQTISVEANGEEVFSFEDTDFYANGNSIAFRTLGAASINDFYVMAAE